MNWAFWHIPSTKLPGKQFLVWILILLSSCLERIDLLPPDTEPQLVVQGFVDNLGRVEVRLRATQNFNSFINESILDDAEVELIENGNLTVPLVDIGDDTFLNFSSEFSFAVGAIYKVRITLSKGEVYESSEEEILPPIVMVDGNAELAENKFVDKNLIEQVEYTHNVTIEIQNENDDQFFITDNSAFEEVEIEYPADPCVFRSPGTPPTCWAFRDEIISGDINLGSNQNLGTSNYDFVAQEVPFGFKRQYVAIVRLQRMSLAQFTFWNDVQTQLNRPGSLFDREFSPILGNVRQVNGEKVALGYFAAYGTSSMFVCFDRFDVPLTTNIPKDTSCSIPCTDWFAPATFEDVGSILCSE